MPLPAGLRSPPVWLLTHPFTTFPDVPAAVYRRAAARTVGSSNSFKISIRLKKKEAFVHRMWAQRISLALLRRGWFFKGQLFQTAPPPPGPFSAGPHRGQICTEAHCCSFNTAPALTTATGLAPQLNAANSG